MKSKTLYVRAVSILLTVSLICSACGAQDTGKQSLSATGAAVLTPPGVETESPAGIVEDDTEEKEPEETTNKDEKEAEWDTNREVKVKKDGFTYHAYLSKDGKESWIYMADAGKNKAVTMAFPRKVKGAVLTKIGKDPIGDNFYDIFGQLLEPYHNIEGWGPNKQNIHKIISPPTVKTITTTTFSGFGDLEEIVLPEQLQEIEGYLLFACVNLKKIVLPRSPDFTDVYLGLTECNRIREVRLPEGSDYCIKDGMLLSKDKKTLYQVFVTGKTVVVPEGITRIAEGAINASLITKIQSVRLPSTLVQLDREAIRERSEVLELDSRIKSITVARNNPVLAQSGDFIFNRKSGELAVVVGTKKNMTLPDGVRYIGDAVSQVGEEIQKLVIPAGFKGFTTNKCFLKGIRIETGGAVEFLSAVPPAVESKGEKMEWWSSICFLIVPKEGAEAYKKWFPRAEDALKENELEIITKGDKACIVEKDTVSCDDLMIKYGFKEEDNSLSYNSDRNGRSPIRAQWWEQ